MDSKIIIKKNKTKIVHLLLKSPWNFSFLKVARSPFSNSSGSRLSNPSRKPIPFVAFRWWDLSHFSSELAFRPGKICLDRVCCDVNVTFLLFVHGFFSHKEKGRVPGLVDIAFHLWCQDMQSEVLPPGWTNQLMWVSRFCWRLLLADICLRCCTNGSIYLQLEKRKMKHVSKSKCIFLLFEISENICQDHGTHKFFFLQPKDTRFH